MTLAVFGTFANSLLSSNLTYVAGGLGLTSEEASWLTVAYVGMRAGANLFVIKARIQFGIRVILNWGLSIYAAASMLAIFAPGFWTMLLARAANGFITSTGVAMAIYYLLEVVSPKARAACVPLVLGLTQMATPLARLVPVEIVSNHQARGLNLIAASIALTQVAMQLLWPLSPLPRPPFLNSEMP